MDSNNLYNEKFYPDRQENEAEIYSNCSSCGEPLYVGDEAVDYYGSLSCDLKTCIIKMVDAKIVTLESGEE